LQYGLSSATAHVIVPETFFIVYQAGEGDSPGASILEAGESVVVDTLRERAASRLEDFFVEADVVIFVDSLSRGVR
tara:strand:+ start:9299 stop:9526 length:228 start_codon:yes stop_codon:yes gene_type:complete